MKKTTSNTSRTKSSTGRVKPSIVGVNILFLLVLLLSNLIITLVTQLPAIQSIKNNDWYRYLNVFFNEGIFYFGFALIYLLATRREISSVTRIGKGINGWQTIIIVCLLLTSSVAVAIIQSYWVEILKYFGYTTHDLGFPTAKTATSLIVGLVSIGFAPAFCEEFMFRGVVMRGYENYGKVAAVVVSALLFGLMHGTLEQLVYAILFGAVIGAITTITDSFWAGMLFHFLNNARTIFVLYAAHSTDLAKSISSNAQVAITLGQNAILTLVLNLLLTAGLLILLYMVSLRRGKQFAVANSRGIKNFAAYLPLIVGIALIFYIYYASFVGKAI